MPPGVDKCVVVEHHLTRLCLVGCLLNDAYFIFQKLCLTIYQLLTNETEHDIAIPPRCTVAELHVVESLLPPPNSPSNDESLPVKELDFTIHFGKSQLPQEWKDSITKQLREM